MPKAGDDTPKRQRLEHDERRALILASARRLFCTRSYGEISMADIAEAAGVARGLLHHYFGAKRDLYLAVVRDVVTVPAMPMPAAAPDLTPERIWAASVEGWMDLVEANRDVWLTAIGAGGTGRDPEIDAILNDAREVVAVRALAAVGVDAADITPQQLALVRGFGGFTEEVGREWLDRGRLSRVEAREALLRTLPMLIEQVLPAVLAAGAEAAPRKRRPRAAAAPS